MTEDSEFFSELGSCEESRWVKLVVWMIEHERLGVLAMYGEGPLRALLDQVANELKEARVVKPRLEGMTDLAGYASAYPEAGMADFLDAVSRSFNGPPEQRSSARCQAVTAHRNMAYLSSPSNPVERKMEISTWQAVNFNRPL